MNKIAFIFDIANLLRVNREYNITKKRYYNVNELEYQELDYSETNEIIKLKEI